MIDIQILKQKWIVKKFQLAKEINIMNIMVKIGQILQYVLRVAHSSTNTHVIIKALIAGSARYPVGKATQHPKSMPGRFLNH